MATKSRILAVLLAGTIVAVGLPGCSGGGQPSAPASSSSPSSPVSTAPARPPASAVVTPSIANLTVAFQQMEMAVMTFRNMEAANTDSTGVIRAVGYAAASNDMQKKRNAFEQLLAQTSSSDVPQIEEIRKAYAPVGKDLKAYITVTTVSGILGGPDARASTLNYGLFAVKAVGFKKTLTRLQSEAGTANAAANSEMFSADKGLKDAYEKYYGLVNAGADPAQVKAAATEVEQAKIRLQQLQGR